VKIQTAMRDRTDNPAMAACGAKRSVGVLLFVTGGGGSTRRRKNRKRSNKETSCE